MYPNFKVNKFLIRNRQKNNSISNSKQLESKILIINKLTIKKSQGIHSALKKNNIDNKYC